MTSDLGRRVAYLRRRRGWSQRRLASAANVSNSTISRIENGTNSDFTITALTLVAAALDHDLVSLLAAELPDQAWRRQLGTEARRALVALAAPGRPAVHPDGLHAEITALREARMRCDFARTAALAPALLRRMSPTDLPQETAHVCYDLALSLRMLGHHGEAWLAVKIAQTAAANARSRALLDTVLALQAVFAMEDGELAAAHAIVSSVPKIRPATRSDACGSAALHLIEGLVHAHIGISDGSDQVRDATALLSLDGSGTDLLDTGIDQVADVGLWAMKIANATGQFARAHDLAGPCPDDTFGASLWHLNMCAVQLQLDDAEHAAQRLLTAHEIAPQLLPSRPETIACASSLISRRLRPDTRRRIRSIHETALRPVS
ncbi:helix-turn-helix domain-containing protein [Allocatelliglobosispora scoriae]|nr:helix-turn-helix domain-containing protein [Allocatelliglobosispora scoriae]